jgi:hypothetical protein
MCDTYLAQIFSLDFIIPVIYGEEAVFKYSKTPHLMKTSIYWNMF